MKIVLLADYYPAYLSAFAMQHAAALSRMGYQEHLECLLADYFGSFGSYRNHFRRLGYESELIVANDYPLQQKWLTEHRVKLTAGPETKQQVALEQLRAWRPAVLFMASMFDYYGPFLREVADSVTRDIFVWIACPHPSRLDFGPVRCVLSSVMAFVNEFRRAGVKSERLRAAFDDEVLPRLGDVPQDLTLSFIGGMSPAMHAERVMVLSQVLDAGLPLEIWGQYGGVPHWRRRIRSFFMRDHLRGTVRGESWGLQMYRTLARSRVTLNVHGDLARRLNLVGNMRLYEATGCGALLVTDDAPELGELFTVDKEVVAFKGVEELIERLRYYLAHPQESACIAAAGHKACLDRHTYRHRIEEFSAIVRSYML